MLLYCTLRRKRSEGAKVVDAEDNDNKDDLDDDNMKYLKYFADVLNEDDSEDYIIVPEGHKYAGIRI